MQKKSIYYFLNQLYLLEKFIFAICLLMIGAGNAQSFNRSQMQGADINVIFVNEVMFNQPDWRYGLIDVKLQPQWKTYWKNSGNSGLAPDLQIENNIKAELLFPTPHLFREEKNWAYIYKDHAQILFRINAKDISDRPLNGNLLIGICNTICIPVTVDIMLNNQSTNNFIDKLKIQIAFQALPQHFDKYFFVKKITQQDKNIEVTLSIPSNQKNVELFLASEKAQLGIAKPISYAEPTIIFSAPIISGQLHKGQSIDYIAKVGNQSIAGTVNIE